MLTDNTQNDPLPLWRELRRPVRIASEAGLAETRDAIRLFILLRSLESLRAPIIGLWIDGEPVAPAAVGALNIYLGSAGLRGLARTMGRHRPCSRWDWERLCQLTGISSNVAQSVDRAS